MSKHLKVLLPLISGVFLLSFLLSVGGQVGFAQAESSKSIHQIDDEAHANDIRVPAAALGGPGEVIQLDPTASPQLKKEVFGFHPYWLGDAYLDYDYNLVSTIAYFGVKIDASGTVSDKQEWPHYGLINKAHQNGVRVVLVARNFNNSEITTLLSSSTNRTRAVNNLFNEVKNAGADGINIDLEGVSGSQRANLTAFIKALATKFHTGLPGSQVTISTPAVDWADAFDFTNLAKYSDGLMIMGYDYHYAGSSQAGPVAPLSDGGKWSWPSVSDTIIKYLKDAPANKLIMGVPYYGWDWPVVDVNEVPTDTTGTATARSYSSMRNSYSQYKTLWDSASSTPYKKYSDRQIWFDNAKSLGIKYQHINDKGLKGVGIWALGYDGDYPDLWNEIKEHFGGTPGLNKNLSIVTGAGLGGSTHLRAFDLYGNSKNPNIVNTLHPDFRGGINVALGDINGDGIDEIFVAPKVGGGPQVAVFKSNGDLIKYIWPFHPDSRTGVNIATGDADGDGKDELVVSQAENGHAWVKVYKVDKNNSIMGEWNAYGNVESGASVAMGDVDGDGKAEVITGAGPGGGPHVRVFEADGVAKSIWYMAFHPDYRGGVDVAAGDISGDGRADIGICQKTEQAWCKAYRYNSSRTLYGQFKAYGDFPVGANLDMGDIDNDGRAEIITGAAIGGPHVRGFEYNGRNFEEVNFFAYDPAFRGGVDVAIGRIK